MLFMAHWTYRPEHRNAMMTRFKETGGAPVPKGVKLLGRWTAASGGQGWNVVETDDASLIVKACMDWSDLMTIDYSPVVTDEDLAKLFK